jgi:hypothetical protein
VDYDSGIHSTGLGVAAVGALALEQMWLPLIAVSVVIAAAVAIRVCFRRRKNATDA